MQSVAHVNPLAELYNTLIMGARGGTNWYKLLFIDDKYDFPGMMTTRGKYRVDIRAPDSDDEWVRIIDNGYRCDDYCEDGVCTKHIVHSYVVSILSIDLGRTTTVIATEVTFRQILDNV